jgi:hypothetical protein
MPPPPPLRRLNLRTFLNLLYLVGSDSLFVVGSLLSVAP